MFWNNVMQILLVPTVATSLLFFYNKYYKKEKKEMQLYFNMYFSLMLIKLFFFTIKLAALEDPDRFLINTYEVLDVSFENINQVNSFVKLRVNEELFFLKDDKKNFIKQSQDYQKKKDYEFKEGHRCFNEANKLCLMIPNCTDREVANKLFEIAIATASGYALSGYGGVIVALVGELTLYLQNSVIEYQKMKSLLLEAQMHYDLAAFYQKILDQ